jgi:hypothetical protein
MTTKDLIKQLSDVVDIMKMDPDEAQNTLSDIIDRVRDEGVTEEKAS